jgi:CcmD family protein
LNDLVSGVQTVVDTVNNMQVMQKSAGSDIYIVLWITLIVWVGIFLYLVRLDRKLKKLKQNIEFDDLYEEYL